MQEALVLARPPGQAQQLMLLLHAAGTTAAAMAPLGAVLAREFPAAFIVGIEAPLAAEGGSGRTWYPAAWSRSISCCAWPGGRARTRASCISGSFGRRNAARRPGAFPIGH